MALTGLFLILFLVIHLIGNWQLLKHDGGRAFNTYAEFMSMNAFIQVISKGNFFFIILHACVGIWLTVKNRAARGSVGYVKHGNASPWTSRNMGILGFIILVFLVVHVKDFYANMHYTDMTKVTYDDVSYRDIYSTVSFWFSKAWYVGLYVFCMAGLAFHLWHGFSSAFQTLGLNHIKYNGAIRFVGRAFAIIVPALFAYIPVSMFFNLQS